VDLVLVGGGAEKSRDDAADDEDQPLLATKTELKKRL